ncbi:DUF6428 family protein [Maribacter sp. 2-571]|uniref:DUF6428 family protein n=1 Tax=Maribacter sp. 2-571 TaxID=3417569 RepID=UPI003D3282F1
MKTKEFLSLLETSPQKSLVFSYANNRSVGKNYHITEVKNVTVDTVDCGGKSDFWKETVVQLWESPTEKDALTYMSTRKALQILKRVDAAKPMERDVEIKFEYGNDHFHTAQLYVHDLTVTADRLTVQLGSRPTDCKAKESCGIPVEKTTVSAGQCAPGSGCC